MEIKRLKSLLETLIFVADKPIKTSELWEALQASFQAEQEAGSSESPGNKENLLKEQNEVKVLSEASVEAQLQAKAEAIDNGLSKADILQALQELAEQIRQDESRGLILVEVAGGWQFRTRPENAAVVRALYQPKPTKFSKPGLETLSIVAYRQPVTKIEVDEIRGVDSGGVLKTLCEKNLVRIVGKKDEPGKPMLYGTTQEFLELFQLKSLKELPTLKDYRDLEAEFQKQQVDEGIITSNLDTEEEERSILDLAVSGEINFLDSEEESILTDLEENIKGLRDLEKEIFVEEKPQENTAGPSKLS